MRNEDTIRWFVGLSFAAGVAFMVVFNNYSGDLWVPNVATSLLSIAATVWFFNVVIARREHEQRRWFRRVRKARTALRALRRRRARIEFVGSATEWPIQACIDVAQYLVYEGLKPDKSIRDVLQYIRGNAGEYRRRSDELMQHLVLYGKYLTPRELALIQRIRQSEEALAHEPDSSLDDDGLHKVIVVNELDWMALCSRELATGLNMQMLHPRIDEFRKLIGRLRRHWTIPDVKARLREQELPLVLDVDAPLASPVTDEPGT